MSKQQRFPISKLARKLSNPDRAKYAARFICKQAQKHGKPTQLCLYLWQATKGNCYLRRKGVKIIMVDDTQENEDN